MGRVMFACVCDRCKKRSEEYGTWYRCVECSADVCDDCSINHNSDVDGATAICKACAVDADAAALADALAPKCATCGRTTSDLTPGRDLCAICDIGDLIDKADQKYRAIVGNEG